MKLSQTSIAGVIHIAFESFRDERGEFARYFDADVFERAGMCTSFSQGSRATNDRAGTLRGLHVQADPEPEVKLLRCTRGGVFDVLLDVRPSSATYGTWQSFQLSQSGDEALYVPAGVAHGYQTLTDGAIVEYLIAGRYDASLQRGFRWDSPSLAIPWPLPVAVLSKRDREFPFFEK